jgi:excisionase family DNA binding protein
VTTAAVTPAAYTVKQAATYLGVSTRTLYRITAECGAGAAEIPVIHVRGRRLFLKADLDAYLARHTLGASA